MKVRYRMASGYETTAYLDDEANVDGSYSGTNKHTDEPVTVRWTGDEWIEVGGDGRND
jgi:hypothetical protein